MKRIGIRIAILAIDASAVPSWAGGADGASVGNCTWCHGGSEQGYMVAPRLAGHRPQYIESQLRSSRAHPNIHFRDSTCGARSGRWTRTRRANWQSVLEILHPWPPMMATAISRRVEDNLHGRNSGSQYRFVLCLPWTGRRGRERHSSSGWTSLFRLKSRTPAMGPRISFGRGVSDADGRKPPRPERN